MPTYRNTTETSKILGIYGSIEAGTTVTVTKYVPDLDPAFELISHDPAPWKQLHATTLPVSLSGLCTYSKIRIVNKSGNSVSVVANGDSDDTLTIIDSTVEVIRQDRSIETLDITGAGEGIVYIDGF